MFESGAAGEEAVAALGDVLERVRSLQPAAVEAAAWSERSRQRLLTSLDALVDAVALVRAPVLIAAREARGPLRAGDRSFVEAVGRASGHGLVEARREVRQAETLATMPRVAGAVASGSMTIAHVDALARVVGGASGGAGVAAVTGDEGEAAVVRLAEGRDAVAFQRELARWVADRDPAAHERDHAAQRSARFLVLSDQPAGTFLKGRLDRLAGERLRLALEASGQAPDDGRSREQACADALVALADAALSGAGGTGSGSQRRPHVSLLLREETFAALQAEQHARVGRRAGDAGHDGATEGSAGRGAALSQGVQLAGAQDGVAEQAGARPVVAPAAVTESGVPVPRSEVARILCDATVARIVVDADDVPLNLGTSQRLYTGAQRRAVIARDKECAWPGCGMPARWSEVHHVKWWAREGGETSVDNGCLLCAHHHHLVHAWDLVIERQVAAGVPRRETREGTVARGEPPGITVARGAPPSVTVHRGEPPGVAYVFRDRAGRVVAPQPERARSRAPLSGAAAPTPQSTPARTLVPAGPAAVTGARTPAGALTGARSHERGPGSAGSRPLPAAPPGREVVARGARGAPETVMDARSSPTVSGSQPSFFDMRSAAQPAEPPW